MLRKNTYIKLVEGGGFVLTFPGALYTNRVKVKQAGEKLHAILNNIERRLEKIKNKAQRYWFLLREYENFIMCDLTGFAPQKRGRYKPRKNKSKAKKVTFSWKK